MRYILDTNIISYVVRNPHGNVAKRLARVGTSNICTSIIVAAELRYGAKKRGSVALSAQLEAVLGRLEIIPFEEPADTTYAVLRTELERAGKPIGANDLLIAAHALALSCILVTDNEKEFVRVPHLKLENWLR